MGIVEKNIGFVVATATAFTALMGVDAAHSQEDTVEGAIALETIVVTARKRAEDLQDVGGSVSAIGATELARRFDVDLQSFSNAAPNVMIDDLNQGPGNQAAIAIRGIGISDLEKSFDPAAGVVLDGVFIGANSAAMIKALDLQGMEILRGPQGTLFGRNAIAGVINVTRRRPDTEEFAAEVRAGYGNHSDVQLDGYINIPINDQWAFKIGGAKRERDGWFRNRTLGIETGDTDYRSVSPSVLWRPTSNLEFYYRFDKSWQDQDSNVLHNMAQPDQAFCFFYNQCAQSVTRPQSGDRYTVLVDGEDPNAYMDTETHIFNAKWNVTDDYLIEYIFGSLESDEAVYQDWDGTALMLYHTDRPSTYSQISHELRLTATPGDRLSYTIGAYFWNSDYRIDLTSYIGFGDFLYGLPAGTILTVPQTVKQDTDSYAVFFEGDYRFGDNLTLTLGGRYTRDEKDSAVIDPLMPELAVKGGFDNPFNKTWSEFTPKVSLRYRVSPDLMVYGLYSAGFRAGGFSGRANTYEAASTAYDPETVDNFELGFKSEWLDHRLRVNAALYFMKYDDKQEELSAPISQGTGQQTLVLNAASAEIKGLELEILAAPFEGFTLAGSLGLIDAEYKDFVDPITGGDLTFLKMKRAPDWTATITPTYEWPMFGGTMAVQASWHYIDDLELNFFNSPQSHNDAQHIIDASINYQYNNTTVSLYGLNLGDEDSWAQSLDVGRSLDFGGLWTYTAPRPPRLYGIRLTQRF